MTTKLLPPLKPLSSLISNAKTTTTTTPSKTKILFVPLWILDELSRIYSVLNRGMNENFKFISDSIFPILLCGIKNQNMGFGYNSGSFECDVVGGCLSGIKNQNQNNNKTSDQQQHQQLFLDAIFPSDFSILRSISNLQELEAFFASKDFVAKPLPSNFSPMKNKNSNSLLVYVPNYLERTNTTTAKDENFISVTITSKSNSETVSSFQIAQNEYDPENFIETFVLPKIKSLPQDSNMFIVTPTKIQFASALKNSLEFSESNVLENETEKKKNQKQQQQQFHQGVEYFPFIDEINNKNNNNNKSSKAQLQISLQFLQNSSSSASLAKWEVISPFDLSWCPIKVPIYPDVLRAAIHRLLLFPPCPFLSSPSMILSVQESFGKNVGVQDHEQNETSCSLLFFEKMSKFANSTAKNNIFQSFSFVRGPFDLHSSSLTWDSTYLSVFTILSWFTKQKGFLSNPSLNLMISKEARTFFDSVPTTTTSLHFKLQKILTLCDATKSGKFSESFLGSKSSIGAIEALLAFQFLLLNVTAISSTEIPSSLLVSNQDGEIEMMNRILCRHRQMNSLSPPLAEPFEFRMVRFQVELLEDYLFDAKEVDEFDQEEEIHQDSISSFLFPTPYVRMIVNHFDKSGSPILMEIEGERSKKIIQQNKKTFTIVGVEFDHRDVSVAKKDAKVNSEVKFYVDHHHEVDEQNKKNLKWITVTDLLIPFLNLEDEDEEERIPASCIMIFPVLNANACL